MIIKIRYKKKAYKANLEKPLDISIPLIHNAKGPKCFYAPGVSITPVISGDWIGDTRQGSPVNFKNVTVNPHGNGTHTECVGHISTEVININKVLRKSLYISNLVTIKPQKKKNGDQVITKSLLIKHRLKKNIPALIIRTRPNTKDKKSKDYSGSNPPYLTAKAIRYIVAQGVKHLLIDLPSVDREKDDGKLSGHKAYWSYPETIDKTKTITEMVFVPNSIKDGLYLCDIQICNLALDASPSRPILYKLF